MDPNGLLRPPDVPTIMEEGADSPSSEYEAPREDNRTVERAEEDRGEYGRSYKILCRSIFLIIVQYRRLSGRHRSVFAVSFEFTALVLGYYYYRKSGRARG